MLSVIVPATDSPATLDACLEAVHASVPDPAEVIVQASPPFLGPAGARNLAARRATGDVLVFVDSDVLVHPEALRAIAERFDREPALTALFGAYDDRPPAPGTVSRFRNLLHHHVHVASAGRAESFWAGLGAIRRDAFEAAGGFDSRRYPRPAIEDIELGARLAAGGARIELDPTILGTHLKAWSLRSMLATDFARRGVPWTRLQLERRRRARELNLAPRGLVAAGSALGIAMSAAFGRPRAMAVATAAMVTASAPLYRLLTRAGGPRLALAGVPLQALHLLAAVASVPAGIAAHLAAGARHDCRMGP